MNEAQTKTNVMEEKNPNLRNPRKCCPTKDEIEITKLQ
jgi:hypothetical protein